MRVFALAASPRQQGNTESLLDLALAEIEAAGHVVSKRRLGEYLVSPCLAHPECRRSAECLIRDDFPALADEAHQADAVLFAVPVYYWGVPAQFKAFIDRHLHYYGRSKYKARAVGLIVIAGDDGIEETEQQMRNFLETGAHSTVPWPEVLVLHGYASGREEAMGNEDLVERARELGRSVVARLAGH